MNKSKEFKWKHYEPEIILWGVRWYCRYAISYRELEEMMLERGLEISHTTPYRWVQQYAPEIEKRIKPHLKRSTDSYRIDETYIKIKGKWKYLYRAVDTAGDILGFLLTSKRNKKAAKRFFKKMLGNKHVGVLSPNRHFFTAKAQNQRQYWFRGLTSHQISFLLMQHFLYFFPLPYHWAK